MAKSNTNIESLVVSLTKTESYKFVLASLQPYVCGTLNFSSIICNDFLNNLFIKDCTPTGKVPTNEFVLEILKMYQRISYDLSCVNKFKNYIEVANIHYGVNISSFVGKYQKKRAFRPSLELVRAIFCMYLIMLRGVKVVMHLVNFNRFWPIGHLRIS